MGGRHSSYEILKGENIPPLAGEDNVSADGCCTCGRMSSVFRRMSNFMSRIGRKDRVRDGDHTDNKRKDKKGRKNKGKFVADKQGEVADTDDSDFTETAEVARTKAVAREGLSPKDATRADIHSSADGISPARDSESSEGEERMTEGSGGDDRGKKKRGKKKNKQKVKDVLSKEQVPQQNASRVQNGVCEATSEKEDHRNEEKVSKVATTQSAPRLGTCANSQKSGINIGGEKELKNAINGSLSDTVELEAMQGDIDNGYKTSSDVKRLTDRKDDIGDEVSGKPTSPMKDGEFDDAETASHHSGSSQEELDAEAMLAFTQSEVTMSSPTSSADSGIREVDIEGGEVAEKEKPQMGGFRKILRRKISQTLTNVDLEQCDPEICISLLKIPSVQTFGALKKKLKNSGKDWMQGFLDSEGLDALLDCIDSLGSRRVTQLSEALLLLECVACVKCVMNSKMGLELLVQSPDYVRRLVKALDTTNVMVKKQVIELLSALCVYSPEGHRLALDALETFKVMKKLRYRFSLLVTELRTAELVAYKTTLMAFINCILVSCDDDLQERCRIRSEFIGLNLLDIIHTLRNEDDDDLIIQCDVFDDEKTADDEALSAEMALELDVTDHREVFDAVYQKVYNTPAADVFLHILQSLLQLDEDNTVSDARWALLELAAQRTLHIDAARLDKVDPSAVDRLLISSESKTKTFIRDNSVEKSVQTDDIPSDKARILSPSTGETIELTSVCGNSMPGAVVLSDVSADHSVIGQTGSVPVPPLLSNGASAVGPTPPLAPPLPLDMQTSVIPSASAAPAPPPPPPPPLPGSSSMLSSSGPPPPPPLPGLGGPPPPPPLPGMGGPPPPPPLPGMGGPPPPPPLPGMGGPPPPPPLPGMGGPPPPPPAPGMGGVPRPPTLSFGQPVPNTLSPISIPTPKHKMKTFNWSKLPPQALNTADDNVWKEVLEMDDKVEVKYDDIEELFCQKAAESKKKVEEQQTKAKVPTEVNLLDTKRSMNANIFLKQFKASNQEVVKMIKEGQQERIGAERLRGLQKILPEKDEIEIIQAFGDKDKLGNAEKFYFMLSQLPGYKMRVEGMLLKDDFRVAMDSLRPNVDVIIRACEGLMNSETLKAFLRYVLHAGNFINAGGYAGNALGFKVASLTKLMDTRANKPRVTLLHYLVEEAEKDAKDVLNFAKELLPSLTEASRLTVDNLTAECKQLESSVQKLQTQVSESEQEVQEQFNDFIKTAKEELESIRKKIGTVTELTHKLCVHFCESEKTFKLEELLSIFKNFCEKVIQCKKENEQRKLQEERAEKRRLEQEAMKARSKDDMEGATTSYTRQSRVLTRIPASSAKRTPPFLACTSYIFSFLFSLFLLEPFLDY